jgi:hypothetical protein
MWDPPVSHRFPRPARLSARSLHVAAMCRAHAACLRHKGVGRQRRCPNAPPSTASPPTPTSHSRRLRAGRHRAARAAVSSTPRLLDAAVADSAGKPWCRCFTASPCRTGAAVSSARRCLPLQQRPPPIAEPLRPSSILANTTTRLLLTGGHRHKRRHLGRRNSRRCRASARPRALPVAWGACLWAAAQGRPGKAVCCSVTVRVGCADTVPLGRGRIRPSGI